jgi:transposase-like protein
LTEPGRHNTNPPFSQEEVALIRVAVMSPDALVECPRCGSPLTIEAVAGEVQGAGWWIYCEKCRRNLVVHSLPERPASEHE